MQLPVNGESSTRFEVRADDTEKLPLVNFEVSDFGNAHQKFGFELGEVCFEA